MVHGKIREVFGGVGLVNAANICLWSREKNMDIHYKLRDKFIFLYQIHLYRVLNI